MAKKIKASAVLFNIANEAVKNKTTNDTRKNVLSYKLHDTLEEKHEKKPLILLFKRPGRRNQKLSFQTNIEFHQC
jgi:hypothetical protein